MAQNEKNISINISKKQYAQLNAFANALNIETDVFIKKMALLFTDSEIPVSDSEGRNDLEKNMELMANQLQKNQKFNDLLLRSIYSTQLRLEGQIKKYKKEASKELDKDFERISLIIKSTPRKQLEPTE